MEIEIGPELRALLEVVARCAAVAVLAVAGCGVLKRLIDFAREDSERSSEHFQAILNRDPETWQVETTKQEQPK